MALNLNCRHPTFIDCSYLARGDSSSRADSVFLIPRKEGDPRRERIDYKHSWKTVCRCWLSWERSPSPSLSRDFSYRARWKFLLNIQRGLLEGNTRGSIHYPPSTYADFHVQNRSWILFVLLISRHQKHTWFRRWFLSIFSATITLNYWFTLDDDGRALTIFLFFLSFPLPPLPLF